MEYSRWSIREDVDNYPCTSWGWRYYNDGWVGYIETSDDFCEKPAPTRWTLFPPRGMGIRHGYIHEAWAVEPACRKCDRIHASITRTRSSSG